MNKSALVILHPGFEELEAVAPIDLMARAGFAITLASAGQQLNVAGRSNISVRAETLLSEVQANSLYDVVVLPGGPGINQIRKNQEICRIFKKHSENNRLIACICAAPLLLKDAGLLKADSEYTAFPATEDELPRSTGESTVRDGLIITSKGAGTATEFALEIIEALEGKEKSVAIAESICWPHA